jgi:undecaprenyl-diphosphatase
MIILQTLIMAVVEGITEFLPISSAGHLMLTAQILKLSPSSAVMKFGRRNIN